MYKTLSKHSAPLLLRLPNKNSFNPYEYALHYAQDFSYFRHHHPHR